MIEHPVEDDTGIALVDLVKRIDMFANLFRSTGILFPVM